MRRAASLLAVVGLLATSPLAARAAEPDALTRGVEAYTRGDFATAAESWRQALAEGYDGPRVHYNLATALYRDGRLGPAIAHYLCAATMAPRDADIRANLQRALMERPQGPPPMSPSWLHALVGAVVATCTLSEFALGAMLMYWLAAGAGIALLLGAGRHRLVRRVVIACALLGIILGVLAVARWWSYHHVQRAVVAVESAPLHAGPGEGFEAAQILTEGSIVRVLSRDGSWARVNAEGDVRGWVNASALVMVSPGDTHEEREAGD